VRLPSAFWLENVFIFRGMNELPKQRRAITSRGRVIAEYRTANTAVDGRPTASRTGQVLSNNLRWRFAQLSRHARRGHIANCWAQD